MTPIGICHRCPQRQNVRQGLAVCRVDGANIREHAKAGECPKGRFAAGDQPDPRERLTAEANMPRGCCGH